MQRARGYTGLWTIDGGRASLEALPPTTYLSISYYERWFLGLEKRVVEHGLVGEDEIASGHSLHPAKPVARTLGVGDVAKTQTRGHFERPAAAFAQFKIGDRVRTKNINPATHTRLPRYARDKEGLVEAIRGCHVYPDTAAIGQGDHPQWLYTVVFTGQMLWGAQSDPTITVSIEAFEPYLLPA
jgi:nitrile hydratase